MKKLLLATLSLSLMLAGTAFGQTDAFGKVDTVYAELAQIDDHNWSITVNITNDEHLLGLSVPLKLSSEISPSVADSAVYTGGRVEHFAYKGFRPDTAIQCVTLGMVGNLGPTNNKLAPGQGRLATIFVSAMEDKPMPTLTVDTTTTHPNNSLMLVADSEEIVRMLGEEKPTQLDRRVEIYPVFVVQRSE